jgi:hypothetical protein
MRDYVRPHHRTVAHLLARLNGTLLARARCFFGGGTQLAMAFGEYRESRDIDFLCSDRTGYAMLRAEVQDRSLGRIAEGPIELAREVRADRDGIRTFLIQGDVRIKFEILLEARLDLDGSFDRALGVPVLETRYAIAEKFLANTDRGLDDSTLARDLIDLAFVAMHTPRAELAGGLAIAEVAYGAAVRSALTATLDLFSRDRRKATHCISTLRISDTAKLRKGLRVLRRLV